MEANPTGEKHLLETNSAENSGQHSRRTEAHIMTGLCPRIQPPSNSRTEGSQTIIGNANPRNTKTARKRRVQNRRFRAIPALDQPKRPET